MFGQRTHEEWEEAIRLLKEEAELLREENRILREIRDRQPRLSYIKIALGGVMPVGPAKLTVGDKKTATVLGFDQFGAPFAIDFNANPVKWTDDDEAVVKDDPTQTVADPLAALAPGVANIGATCGGFTDTEAVTVVAAVPVLSAIKISID
jgi:hypothetical protein